MVRTDSKEQKLDAFFQKPSNTTEYIKNTTENNDTSEKMEVDEEHSNIDKPSVSSAKQ